jgi:prepilin-type N-terminal cleavage/methylation domain-containing protein
VDRFQRRSGRRRGGFTLVELLISAGIMSVILAVVASVTIYMRKSVEATNHYLLETNNGNRMLDYVGRDLGRAVRVGQLVGGTNTPFKTGASFSVTETNTLTINVPDYYVSNIPANTPNTPFRIDRYARKRLGTLYPAASPAATYLAWSDAVMTVNNQQVPRFAPAGSSDEIQVRYFRATRSAQDKTICYFRQEFSSAGVSLAAPVEVAEQVSVGTSMTALIVSVLNNGQRFQVQSNFIPRFRFAAASAAGTLQMREVRVQNTRRD